VSVARGTDWKGAGSVRSLWKGIIIGGLTGAGAGALADIFDRGARLVATAGQKAIEVTPDALERVRTSTAAAGRQTADLAPELADRVRNAVSDGLSRVHQADISDHLGERAKELVHRVGDSERAEHVRAAVERTSKKGRQLANTMRDTASG